MHRRRRSGCLLDSWASSCKLMQDSRHTDEPLSLTSERDQGFHAGGHHLLSMPEGGALSTLITELKKGPIRETDMKVATPNTRSEAHIKTIGVAPPICLQVHRTIACISWRLNAYCDAGEASLMMLVRMTSGSRLGAIIRSCERPLP